jgi:hypothetical protein
VTLLSSSKEIGVFMSLLAKAKLEVAVNDHAERAAAKRTSFLHQALHIILTGIAWR